MEREVQYQSSNRSNESRGNSLRRARPELKDRKGKVVERWSSLVSAERVQKEKQKAREQRRSFDSSCRKVTNFEDEEEGDRSKRGNLE